MSHVEHGEARAFIEQVLRTGLLLSDLISGLYEDLSESAFPGEDRMEVLLEMVAGSIQPAVDAAGAPAMREARMLLGALGDRVLSDLRAAAVLAKSE